MTDPSHKQGSRWPGTPANARAGHSLKQNPPVAEGQQNGPGLTGAWALWILSCSAKSEGRVQLGKCLFQNRPLATMVKNDYPKYGCPRPHAASPFHCCLWLFYHFLEPSQKQGRGKTPLCAPIILIERYCWERQAEAMDSIFYCAINYPQNLWLKNHNLLLSLTVLWID